MKRTLILLALSVTVLCTSTTVSAQQKTDTAKKVKQIQQPLATIAGLSDGVISKNALLKADSLVCSDNKLRIISFTLTINHNDNLIEVQGKSNLLSADMKKYINNMLSGNKLYFENIKAKLPDGSTRTLSSINLKIQ
jgi:hypothetical protein